MKRIVKSYKIREARQNFSEIIRTVGNKTHSYVIKDRDNPKALIIDYAVAQEYLPSEYLVPKEKTGGERMAEAMEEWLKQHPPKKHKKLVNISENVDKILYGL
jgi:hypothetical protein